VSTVQLLQKSDQIHISDNGRKALPIVPQNVGDQLSQYALHLLRMRAMEQPVDAILREMEVLAEKESIPIIGPLEGATIQMLVQLRQTAPQRVLDIGTAIGYSAIWLARGLPAESKIISIEIDPERAELAKEFIHRAGFSAQIEVLVGDVFDLLPQLEVQFDIILQDVIKHVYFGADSQLSLRLLDYCIELLTDGGLLLGDNVFCMGEVLHEQPDLIPKQVLGIQAYNTRVAIHPLLDSIVLPVRDGLWISQKRSVR
jgi:caffeoyl-CoA O-methyltransferase